MMWQKFCALCAFAAACLFSVGEATAKTYVAEPVLVAPPAYAGMQFYVYRPYNMPKGWYVTFDGYPVTKNVDGVWVYGTAQGPNLVGTNYIVGSVVPSMAGLQPWVRPVEISSMVTLSPSDAVTIVQQSPNVPPQMPQAGRTAKGQQPAPVLSTWVPDWTFNPRFMAIANWQNSVDRMGILHRPAVPVAWKGNSPKVIYVWTGRSWYQINVKEYHRPIDVLKSSLYDITRMVKHNQFKWYAADVPVLLQLSAQWGYYWMGEVVPSR